MPPLAAPCGLSGVGRALKKGRAVEEEPVKRLTAQPVIAVPGIAAEVPVGRLATPEEDAMLAVFLACDEVRFMVGQSIPFAGGWVT